MFKYHLKVMVKQPATWHLHRNPATWLHFSHTQKPRLGPLMLRGKNVPLLLLSSLPLQLATSELPLHVRSPKDAPKPGQQRPTAERRNRINPQVTKSCVDHVTAHGRADTVAAQRKTHSRQHEGFSKD